jgi:low temperature requirement protein LtrA
MFAGGGDGRQRHRGRRPQARVFALGYLVTRLTLLVLYARAWRHVTEARGPSRSTWAAPARAPHCGPCRWPCPAPARYWLWAAGILLEAAGPLVATRYGRDVPPARRAPAERFALFVILVLGESVTSVVKGMYETEWRTTSVVVAAIGFFIAAALWWSYFDLGGAAGKQHLLEGDGGDQGSGTADRYVYGHLPLTLGLAAVGVGIEQYIVHPVGELTTGDGGRCAPGPRCSWPVRPPSSPGPPARGGRPGRGPPRRSRSSSRSVSSTRSCRS